MKLYQLGIALIALVVVREVAGDILMLVTRLAGLANFGGLIIGSFLAGWLAGSISELGPSCGQLKGLAALGVIAAIAIGFLKGVSFLALAVVFMLVIYTPLSYFCLLLAPTSRGAASKSHRVEKIALDRRVKSRIRPRQMLRHSRRGRAGP